MDLKPFKAKSSSKLFLVVAALGALGCVWGLITNKAHFGFSYLTAFTYFLSLALGGLWFVLIQHVTKAGWSVVVRRIAENIASTLKWAWLLVLPLLIFSLHDLFHWTHADAVAHDSILQSKAGYLNLPFFFVRVICFFAIWAGFSHWLLKTSVAQDKTGDKKLTLTLQKWSTVGTILYALTETFFAFDFVMSLNAHWFSTIFGIYYFACSAVGIFSLLIVVSQLLRRNGYLKGIITVEHDHDLGKLLFGFNIFWTYIAFSQWMLIWYANLGEETPFFHMRAVGSWKTYSIVLPILHFVIPFFFLISRKVKRNNLGIFAGALWLLVINYIDIYWLIMPNFHKEGVQFSLMDLSGVLFVGGLFFWLLIKTMEKSSLIPEKDPRLPESLHFENA